MGAYTYNFSSQETEEENCKFEASLGYVKKSLVSKEKEKERDRVRKEKEKKKQEAVFL